MSVLKSKCLSYAARHCLKVLGLTISLSVLSVGVSGQEISFKVISPDSALDTLNQSMAVSTDLPGNWQLDIRGSSRFAKTAVYTDVDQVQLQNEWQPDNNTTIKLTVGRAVANWSPWHGNSVILSGHAPGIDQLQYKFTEGPVSFEKLVGRLSGDDRYLLAHRLSLTLGALTGSIGETVVANGKFTNNLITVLPWPMYWSQWIGLQTGYIRNDDINANVFLQALYDNKKGVVLGAELLVDDMPQWIGEYQLFQVAGQLRAQVPIGEASNLSLQYARVNNYTYAFQVPFGDYTHHGYSLGSQYGPDNDELLVTYNFPRNSIGFTGIGLSLRRKGAGNFGDEWESKGYYASRNKQFLSGVVEHTQLLYVNAAYPLGNNGELTAKFGVGPIQNAKNIAGDNKVHPEGSVELRFRIGK